MEFQGHREAEAWIAKSLPARGGYPPRDCPTCFGSGETIDTIGEAPPDDE